MTVLIILILAIIFVSVFLAVYGKKDNATFNEDAVIVLGKGLDGDKLPVNLANRLDKAVEFHKKNPSALIIVSGGKGSNDKLSEAQAMYDYLISKGVPDGIVIKEDKSTITYENFAFSSEILKEKLGEKYSVVFISNYFHIWRAERHAKELGLNVTHLGAKIKWYTVPANYLREFITFVALLVFKKK